MPDDPNPETPKPLTAEDVATIVNSAITAHDKRNEKRRADETAKLIADAVAKAATSAPPAPSPAPGADPSKAETPEMAALRAQIEEMKKDQQKHAEVVKTEREARKAAEDKARDDRSFNDMRTMLGKHVRPDMLDAVAKLHFYADKRVQYDDDGNPLFKVRRSPGGGLPEEDVLMPLADGVSHWVKSKDSAPWMPAPNGEGKNPSGQFPVRGPGRPPVRTYDKPAQTDDEKVRRAMEREQALADRINSQ